MVAEDDRRLKKDRQVTKKAKTGKKDLCKELKTCCCDAVQKMSSDFVKGRWMGGVVFIHE